MGIEVVLYTQIGSILTFIVALFGLYRLLVKAKDATIETQKSQISFLEAKVKDLGDAAPDILLVRYEKRMSLLENELRIAEEEKRPLIAEIDELKTNSGNPELEAQRESKTLQLGAVSGYAITLERERNALGEQIKMVESSNARLREVEAQLLIATKRAEVLEKERSEYKVGIKKASESEARRMAIEAQLRDVSLRAFDLTAERTQLKESLQEVVVVEARIQDIQSRIYSLDTLSEHFKEQQMTDSAPRFITGLARDRQKLLGELEDARNMEARRRDVATRLAMVSQQTEMLEAERAMLIHNLHEIEPAPDNV